MRLTKEKLKKIIKEEILKIMEEEGVVDDTVKKGKEEMEKEATTILSKIEATAQNTKMSPEILKGFLIQYLSEKQ